MARAKQLGRFEGGFTYYGWITVDGDEVTIADAHFVYGCGDGSCLPALAEDGPDPETNRMVKEGDLKRRKDDLIQVYDIAQAKWPA